MIITEYTLKWFKASFVTLFVIFLIGFNTFKTMPIETMPNIVIPYFLITTAYKGSPSNQINNLITIPIENNIKSVKGVKNVNSKSSTGASTIFVEFDTSVDMSKAKQDIKDAVDRAKPDLPNDIDSDPYIKELNINDQPIYDFSILNSNPEIAYKIAKDLKDKMVSVDGVLEVVLSGYTEKELRVTVNPSLLNQYGITPSNIVNSINQRNADTPGGKVESAYTSYLVGTPGSITDPKQLASVPVKNTQGKIIKLGDIANISFQFADVTSYSRINGVTSISVGLTKRTGYDVIGVTNNIDKFLDEYKKTAPAGTTFVVVNKDADTVKSLSGDLLNSVYTSIIILIVVIMFFMGLVSAFFISVALPLSLFMTYLYFSTYLSSVNIIILVSMIIALGMLVDNAIVIVENIYRHLSLGKNRLEATLDATQEVFIPVLNSTLTTVAAFFPLLFWPGIMGKFLVSLPLTIIIALIASLIVAFTFNPLLCYFFLKVPKNTNAEASETSTDWWLAIKYKAILSALLRNKRRVIFVNIVVVIMSFVIFAFGHGPVTLMNEGTPSKIQVSLSVPTGINKDIVNNYTLAVAKFAENYKGTIVQDILEKVSDGSGSVILKLYPYQQITGDYTKMISEIGTEFSTIPNLQVSVKKMSDMGPPSGDSHPISLSISSKNMSQLITAKDQMKEILNKINGVVAVNDDLSISIPRIFYDVNETKANELGISTSEASRFINQVTSGAKANKYREGEFSYDTYVRYPKEYYSDPDSVLATHFVTQSGASVPLSSFVSVRYNGGNGDIKRKNYRIVVNVYADLDESQMVMVNGLPQPVSVNYVMGKVTSELKLHPLPPEASFDTGGESKDMAESSAFLGKAFLTAVFLIIMVLIVQFNSFNQVSIIMITVIMAMAGTFLGLGLTHGTFSIIMTGSALVSLAGIVVNNGIIMIDFINHLRFDKKQPLHMAIIEGCAMRLRPVMLTAITAILGMIPIALKIAYDFENGTFVYDSPTSQMWQPLGLGIVYGLFLSTLLTLFIVPVLYALFNGDGLGRPFHAFDFVKHFGLGIVKAPKFLTVILPSFIISSIKQKNANKAKNAHHKQKDNFIYIVKEKVSDLTVYLVEKLKQRIYKKNRRKRLLNRIKT